MKGTLQFRTGYPAPCVILSTVSRLDLARLVMPLLIGFSLVLAACGGGATPAPTRTLKPTLVLETRLTAAERASIFDTVWQTVNDQYFDPTFGGKDWQAIGDEYRQKLTTCRDDGALLVYPYGESQTPAGRVLENNGVVPDIVATLNRRQLLQGIDAQLEAALNYLE